MRIAWLATTAEKPKPLTLAQRLHQEAVASLAARKIHDREKAKQMFASEWAELKKLERKFNINQ